MSAPGIIVRPVTSVPELEAIEAIEREVFGAMGWPFFLLRQWLDAMPELVLVACRDPGGDSAVPGHRGAEVVGELVAGLAARHQDAWIYSLGVRRAAQGAGIGARLLEAALDRSRALGATTLWLHVAPASPAVRLYQRCGFEIVRRCPDHFGPGHDRLLMRSATTAA